MLIVQILVTIAPNFFFIMWLWVSIRVFFQNLGSNGFLSYYTIILDFLNLILDIEAGIETLKDESWYRDWNRDWNQDFWNFSLDIESGIETF